MHHPNEKLFLCNSYVGDNLFILYFQLDRELPEILKEFHEDNLDFYSHITVIARRKIILKSACVALSRGYFEWHKTPNIEFVGEMAEDHGGPRREFSGTLEITCI